MTIKEIKSTILKKGWAGKTISREETVQKLNPLIEAHVALNHAYTSLLPLLTSEDRQTGTRCYPEDRPTRRW